MRRQPAGPAVSAPRNLPRRGAFCVGAQRAPAACLGNTGKRRNEMKGMFALIALAATPVFAQEVQTSSQKAPTSAEGALEITLGAGYAQGFGDIGGSQRSLTDLNSAGGEVIVGAGYRIDRHLFVGAYGSGGKHSTADLTN